MVRFARVGLAAVPMCYPSVIRSRRLMEHDEGNTLKSQDNHEGLRALPLNSVECAIFQNETQPSSVERESQAARQGRALRATREGPHQSRARSAYSNPQGVA